MREHHLGDEMARLCSGRFLASSNLRTTTWHLVVLQICLDCAKRVSDTNVSPAAFSTASTVYRWVSCALIPSRKVAHQVSQNSLEEYRRESGHWEEQTLLGRFQPSQA